METLFLKVKKVRKNYTDQVTKDAKQLLKERGIDAPLPGQYEDVIVNMAHVATIVNMGEADRKLCNYPDDCKSIITVNGYDNHLCVTASVEEIYAAVNAAVWSGETIVQV